ncbi:MAG TPA: hypothetical protein VEW48_17955 [Thermoanaerobaculia bacterium]|nr:hypothetical protein [Thermoanaerobaculia bacterium]
MSDDQKNPPKPPVSVHEEATFPPPEPDTVKPQSQTGSTEKETGGRKRRGRQPDVPESAPAKEAPPKLPESITIEDYEKLNNPVIKWQILVKAFQVNRRSILSTPGVTAVDIGYRMKDGVFQNDLALRIHVERKLPEETEDRPNRPLYWFPKGGKCEKAGHFKLKRYEVPTDVIEGDYRPAQITAPPRPGMVLEEPRDSDDVNRRRRLNPLVGGISIGSPRAPSGTLGALVWDNKDGSVCILSNWHILSGDLRVEAGTPCFQPGRLDQGRSTDVVARLKRWSFDRQTDAALAELTGSRHYCTGEILGLPQQILGSTDPYLGMLVQKCGRSTGFTWGFVDGLYFSTAIEYSNGIVQVFEDQIHIAPAELDVRISEPGDSGALWLAGTEAEQYQVVGLHFAGDLPHSAFGEYALANPISVVMKNLDFSFRPRFLEIRDEDVFSPPPLPIQTEEDGADAQPIGTVGSGRLRGSGHQGDSIIIKPGGG